MRSSTLSFTLVVSLASAALVAACGGGAPNPEVPPAPSATAPIASAPPTPTTPDVTPPPKDTPPPPKDATNPPPKDNPPAGKTMPDVTASTLGDGLKGIGLDITKLPKMGALTGAQRSKVMPLISQATGFQCNECHVQGNFKAETPRKQVARKMWDEFTAPAKLATGPVFCDSCHKGQHDFLDRAHKDAVSAYMDAQYTKKLTAKGKDVACTTCHGGDMEMKIFEKVWKVKDMPHAAADAPRPALATKD